mgnify:CR=1 FL=1
MPPRLSIVTAVRNGERFLPDCLHSVAAQKAALEHIIVDGASDDKTPALIGQYAQKQNAREDRTVTTMSEPDRGLYDAMNKGIALASGDIIGTLNADDFFASDDILDDVAAIFREPDVDACYGDLVVVDTDHSNRITRRWHPGAYSGRRFYHGWMPPHPTFFVRTDAYRRYGRFRLDLGSAADYELMLRFLVKHGLRARYLPRTIVTMRAGGISNASLANRLQANRMDRRAWKVNGLSPLPWTVLIKPLRKITQFRLLP